MNAQPPPIAKDQFDSGIRRRRIVADQSETRMRLATAIHFSGRCFLDIHAKAALPLIEVAHCQLPAPTELTDGQSTAGSLSDGSLPAPVFGQVYTSASISHTFPHAYTRAACTCDRLMGSIA